MLLTFNPGKGIFGIPYHTYHPAWLILPFLFLLVMFIYLGYLKYKKAAEAGISQKELERKAIEELTGKKLKRRKRDAGG